MVGGNGTRSLFLGLLARSGLAESPSIALEPTLCVDGLVSVAMAMLYTILGIRACSRAKAGTWE